MLNYQEFASVNNDIIIEDYIVEEQDLLLEKLITFREKIRSYVPKDVEW